MSDDAWLIDETRPLDAAGEAVLARSLGQRRGAQVPDYNLALSLFDVVIHDTQKWFGAADIRLDMLVTTGRRQGEDDPSFFVPRTYTFPAVRDGDTLPIGSGGLIGFYGVPAYFLDVSIIVSRDRSDVDTLAAVLKETRDGEVTDAIGNLGEVIVAPHVAAIKTALDAALALSNAACRLLRAVTGSSIGLYRNAHLQHRDGFGIGRHPEDGSYRRRDLSFRYEISLEG
jgi:hypothetical protein